MRLQKYCFSLSNMQICGVFAASSWLLELPINAVLRREALDKKYEVLFLYTVDRKNSLDLKRTLFYYMEESVLLGTKPLVYSIRHFIRDPSGVFSVCHVCECRIVQ